ncbi:hypothetical protein CABS01_16273 [Colletotrichum abscissum]|uniref:uncharacterized protein n=1 Tax=Colletotrichum abscissum TaxID=1671311 RepID=UPI0027D6464A|nr:uncharacterized protein CABS01_16273 [Colletotrichum abscissum]KAK1472542.1 hypothetical protein CABS01_16273 [Colletotrichum abscissum]
MRYTTITLLVIGLLTGNALTAPAPQFGGGGGGFGGGRGGGGGGRGAVGGACQADGQCDVNGDVKVVAGQCGQAAADA